jgi:hypothetical protein
VARVAVFVEREDARYADAKALKGAADRAYLALRPIFHEVIRVFPKLHGSGGYKGDARMFDWFPQLKSGHGFYRAGGATLRATSTLRANLIAFFGVEARDDGLIRLVGAFALDRQGHSHVELLWYDVQDFLPDGPLGEAAVQLIGDGLRAALPAAMQTWARALERPDQ